MIRTWHLESLAVASVLLAVFIATGSKPVEAISSLAVLVSHGHASVSFRMAENEALKPMPDVRCHSWLARYFVAKEALWLAYFVATQSYAALIGVVIFLVYPIWRNVWRRIHPKKILKS